MALDINPDYLFNFTDAEKTAFYRQQHRENVDITGYEEQLYEMIYSDSPGIFANYGARPFSKLDVKYTINRLAKDDPSLVHLPFGHGDPVQGDYDAEKIAKGIQTNTHCLSFEIIGCGLTDKGAGLILEALKDKKVTIDLSENRLTDITFRQAVQIMSQPENRWLGLSFGKISPSKEVKEMLDTNPKIKYICRQKKGLLQMLKKLYDRQR